MGIKVTIPPLGAVDNSSFLTDLNIGIGRLADEFDNAVYQDGSQAMENHLDMGGKRIYNLAAPTNPTDAMRLVDATSLQVTAPIFTVATGAAGSNVTIGGTYPNLTLTIPRGTTGLSGSLPDGNYNGLIVSFGGTVIDIGPGVISLGNYYTNWPGKTLLGRDAFANGSPSYLTVTQVKTMLDITQVQNTADGAKAISTATQTALNLKADAANAVLTGNPIAPTAAPGDNDTSIATTAFVTAAVVADNTTAAVRTIPVLASAMYPRYTSGPGTSVVETATNKVNFNTVDFDGATNEFAQFLIPMPKGWDEGTVSVQFLWRSTGGTGGVVWGIQGLALSDGDTADSAYGTAATVTDSVISTAALMASPYTAAMTIAGTPAPEDLISFQVYRDAANGSDTSTVDAQLVGVRIKYNVNARDDS